MFVQAFKHFWLFALKFSKYISNIFRLIFHAMFLAKQYSKAAKSMVIFEKLAALRRAVEGVHLQVEAEYSLIGPISLCGTTSENGPDTGTRWPLAYMHWTYATS